MSSTYIETVLEPRMKHIRHKISVGSCKGGVGKTTVAVNLAVVLATRGYKVGLIDADICGPDVHLMLGVKGELKLRGMISLIPPVSPHGIKVASIALMWLDDTRPLLWRGEERATLVKQFLGTVRWGSLDYLIIDLPPGTGDETLSLWDSLSDEGLIIVTTPQELALPDARKTVNAAKEMNLPIIGVVENMSGFVCPHCNTKTDLFSSGGGRRLAKEFEVPFLGSIPLDIYIRKGADEKKTFVTEYPESIAAKAFMEMVNTLLKVLQK